MHKKPLLIAEIGGNHQGDFQKAKDLHADIIITIDGDGQFLPEEIPILIEPIKIKKFDVVIGNRFLDSEEMPSYRKAGNKGYTEWFSFICKKCIRKNIFFYKWIWS